VSCDTQQHHSAYTDRVQHMHALHNLPSTSTVTVLLCFRSNLMLQMHPQALPLAEK
jgi:hypothetical protein